MRPRVMVFDVPASSGGALAILEEHHLHATLDPSTDWVFVVGTPRLAEQPGLQVVRLPWVKRSLVHRLWFEIVTTRRLVRRYAPDSILTLHNLTIALARLPQDVYLHQALALAKPSEVLVSVNWVKRVRMKVLVFAIRFSLRRARTIIVQTNFMKELCIQAAGVPANRIIVRPPRIPEHLLEVNETEQGPRRIFFYPANAAGYKNYAILIDAARLLREWNIEDYEIHLTVTGDENRHIHRLKVAATAERLPIRFDGTMARADVMRRYRDSILVYPSRVESFGLPLYEAKACSAPILVADLPYGREALIGYKDAEFFPHDRPEVLAELMANYLRDADPKTHRTIGS